MPAAEADSLNISPRPEKTFPTNVTRRIQRQAPGTLTLDLDESPLTSRRASLRKIRSRRDDKAALGELERKAGTVTPQMEPSGWLLSTPITSTPFLGEPFSFQQSSPPPKTPSGLGNSIFLEQIKQLARRPGAERSTSDRSGKRSQVDFPSVLGRRRSDTSRRDSGIKMHQITGTVSREGGPVTPAAARTRPAYMPESPMTAGDKRIRMREEAEQRQADRRKSVRMSALRRARQRANHQATVSQGQRRSKPVALNETDEERKKREKESVEAWRAWAAACVATNYIQPRRSLHPHLDKSTPAAPPGVPKGRVTSRSAAPSRVPSPNFASEAPRRLAERDVTDGISPNSKGLMRTRSLDDGRTITMNQHASSRCDRPQLRQAYTEGMEVTIRLRDTSASPTRVDHTALVSSPPLAPSVMEEPNELLVLRNRLSSKIMRSLLLELVQAVAAYVEAVEASFSHSTNDGNDHDEGTIGPASLSSVSFCLTSVRRARRFGVFDTDAGSDRVFWEREVRAVWTDLAEAAGNPLYIPTMYGRAEYHSDDDALDTYNTAPDTYNTAPDAYVRMLDDLEELLWGGLEPPEDELPFAREIEERIKVVGDLDSGPLAGDSKSANKDEFSSWKALTSSHGGSVSTAPAAGRRHRPSVWTNDFLSALQEGGGAGGKGPASQEAGPLASIQELDFTQPGDAWTLACPGVRLLPGLNTLDLDLNSLPVDTFVPRQQQQQRDASSRVGNLDSRSPSVAVVASRRGTTATAEEGDGEGASGKTKEQLAEEGRARYAAWKASRQVQPLN
ncbi:hypothetical protein QFC21_002878 [Naganishia friedmannii]|uniref:Uncharacterized protein n=1 Tax=Naganishia friedmannii TaxID=89922 RepID=A0ACC2VTG2_9TREE|nr:hypothetical protein QFC21_002878 [Naganishia friedmannii]